MTHEHKENKHKQTETYPPPKQEQHCRSQRRAPAEAAEREKTGPEQAAFGEPHPINMLKKRLEQAGCVPATTPGNSFIGFLRPKYANGLAMWSEEVSVGLSTHAK